MAGNLINLIGLLTEHVVLGPVYSAMPMLVPMLVPMLLLQVPPAMPMLVGSCSGDGDRRSLGCLRISISITITICHNLI